MMNLRSKTAALLTAGAMLCGSVAFIPAKASADGVTINIEEIELSLEELQEMDYRVPVRIWLTENAGISAFQFGVRAEGACTFSNTSYGSISFEISGSLDSTETFLWITSAGSDSTDWTGELVTLMVNVPQEAAPGDVYGIAYSEISLGDTKHAWSDVTTNPIMHHVEKDTVDWTDGYIKIEEELPTTEPTTEEPTTEEPTTEEPTTEEPTTEEPTTEEPTTEEPTTEEPTTEESTTEETEPNTTEAPSETGSTESIVKGDVNCDGAVDVLDIITLNRNLLGVGTLSVQGVLNADIDGDNLPTGNDSLTIMKYIVRLIDTL